MFAELGICVYFEENSSPAMGFLGALNTTIIGDVFRDRTFYSNMIACGKPPTGLLNHQASALSHTCQLPLSIIEAWRSPIDSAACSLCDLRQGTCSLSCFQGFHRLKVDGTSSAYFIRFCEVHVR